MVRYAHLNEVISVHHVSLLLLQLVTKLLSEHLAPVYEWCGVLTLYVFMSLYDGHCVFLRYVYSKTSISISSQKALDGQCVLRSGTRG